MHVCFLDILIPRFQVESIVDTIIFKVDHIHARSGTFYARVRGDCWHIWVGEGSQYLIHDDCLKATTVGQPKVLIQILHRPSKLFQGSRTKVEDVTLQFTAPTLKVDLSFGPYTLGFSPSLITYVLLGLGCFPLVFVDRVLLLISFRWIAWFSFVHSLHFFGILRVSTFPPGDILIFVQTCHKTA